MRMMFGLCGCWPNARLRLPHNIVAAATPRNGSLCFMYPPAPATGVNPPENFEVVDSMAIGGLRGNKPRRNFRADVRFGSKADMCSAQAHVRFTLEGGHYAARRSAS